MTTQLQTYPLTSVVPVSHLYTPRPYSVSQFCKLRNCAEIGYTTKEASPVASCSLLQRLSIFLFHRLVPWPFLQFLSSSARIFCWANLALFWDQRVDSLSKILVVVSAAAKPRQHFAVWCFLHESHLDLFGACQCELRWCSSCRTFQTVTGILKCWEGEVCWLRGPSFNSILTLSFLLLLNRWLWTSDTF